MNSEPAAEDIGERVERGGGAAVGAWWRSIFELNSTKLRHGAPGPSQMRGQVESSSRGAGGLGNAPSSFPREGEVRLGASRSRAGGELIGAAALRRDIFGGPIGRALAAGI